MAATAEIQTRIDVKPQAGGQELFFTAPEYEVLFGGHAGPGKTWALVYDAGGFQFGRVKAVGKPAVMFPDYRAVIFRRKTTELMQIIDEGRKIYCPPPLNAEYVQQRRGEPGPSFTFASGAKIFCCHLQREDDKYNHHGLQYQYIGFDELTTFTLTQYLYMFHRCRSIIPGLWPRIRATTNPVGPGLVWVKKRFIKNGDFVMQPYKSYYFSPDMSIDDPYMNPTGLLATRHVPDAKSRTYIPGHLNENKYIQDRPGYEASIKQMGRKYASALLAGDWDVFSGDFFEDFGPQLRVKPFEIPDYWKLTASLDPGWSSPCSAGLTAVDPKGGLWRLFTYYVSGKSPTQHAKSLREYMEAFQYTGGRMPDQIVCGHDAFRPEKREASGDRVYFADVLREQGFVPRRATTSRVPGWWAWKDAMRRKLWHYFDGYNGPLVEEIVAAQHDEMDPEDIMGRGNDPTVFDHALDENRYGVMAAYRPDKPARIDPFAGRPQWGVKPETINMNDPRVIWGPDE